MDFSDLEKVRLEKMQRLRAGGMEPFPTRAHPTQTTAAAIEEFKQAETAAPEDTVPEVKAILAGRLRSMRPMGKVTFAHIEDGSGRIQLFFRVNELGAERMALFADNFDLGDFMEAEGTLFRTKTGEITLHVSDFRMLSKALSPLPLCWPRMAYSTARRS